MSSHTLAGIVYVPPNLSSRSEYTVQIDGNESAIQFRNPTTEAEFDIRSTPSGNDLDIEFVSNGTMVMLVKGDPLSTVSPLSFPNVGTTELPNPTSVLVADTDGNVGFSDIGNFAVLDPSFDSISLAGTYDTPPQNTRWIIDTSDHTTHLDLNFKYATPTANPVLILHDVATAQVTVTMPFLSSNPLPKRQIVTSDEFGNIGSLVLGNNQLLASYTQGGSATLAPVSGTNGIVVDAQANTVSLGGDASLSSIELEGVTARSLLIPGTLATYNSNDSNYTQSVVVDSTSINPGITILDSAGGILRAWDIVTSDDTTHLDLELRYRLSETQVETVVVYHSPSVGLPTVTIPSLPDSAVNAPTGILVNDDNGNVARVDIGSGLSITGGSLTTGTVNTPFTAPGYNTTSSTSIAPVLTDAGIPMYERISTMGLNGSGSTTVLFRFVPTLGRSYVIEFTGTGISPVYGPVSMKQSYLCQFTSFTTPTYVLRLLDQYSVANVVVQDSVFKFGYIPTGSLFEMFMNIYPGTGTVVGVEISGKIQGDATPFTTYVRIIRA